MPKEITGFRVAKIDLANVDDTPEVSQEIDFDFGAREGVALYVAEFIVLPTHTESSTFQEFSVNASLHVENDALEDTLDDAPATGVTNLDSEIIAELEMRTITQDEAATRGGSAAAMGFVSPHRWDYMQMLGGPLLIATNPTLRAVSNSSSLIVDIRLTLWFKYVELSNSDIVSSFFRRRI